MSAFWEPDLRVATPEHVVRRHQDLLKGIYDMGFTKPSKIQERALPLLLANPCVRHANPPRAFAR